MNKILYGIAVNDADYKVTSPYLCPFYDRWKGMIKRCYSKKHHEKFKSYEKCSVCDEWLVFSKFKEWMEKQNWVGKQLDKDILVIKNTVYSPSTCCFVDLSVNGFVKERWNKDDGMPAGVRYCNTYRVYVSSMYNPFTHKRVHVGTFTNVDDAHKAWLVEKSKYASMLADTIDDDRVANALRVRYTC